MKKDSICSAVPLEWEMQKERDTQGGRSYMPENLQWILVVFWGYMGMESEKLQEVVFFFFYHICECWVAEIKQSNVIDFPLLLDK